MNLHRLPPQAVVDELPKGSTGKILKRAIDPESLRQPTAH
jgi:acyl-coenzyme A synthetase/AMP-(fatty) acid ligase